LFQVSLLIIMTFPLIVGVLVCEAGCVLESLEAMLSDKGLVMPLDLASKGRSVKIGGGRGWSKVAKLLPGPSYAV